MADKKISQLANASTPLAGTEVLPIVQSGSTVKVSVDNLTKGKTVSASTFDTDVAAAKVTLSATTLAAAGTDSNIDINLTPKGTGEVNITKVDIDSGAIDGTAIGANSASSGSFTTLTTSSTVTINGGTANGVLYLDATKIATSGSAVTFDGTNFATTGTSTGTKFIPTGGTATGNGMYLAAANAVAFSTNGSERVRIVSGGDVGIGTNSPAALLGGPGLHIKSGYGQLTLQRSTAGTGTTIDITNAAGTLEFRIGTNFASGGNNLLFAYGTTPTLGLILDTNGNFVVNNAAIATNATNGFLYVPGCAGTPTGTPTAYTGRVPIVVDTTNNKLYFYSNSAWRDAGP